MAAQPDPRPCRRSAAIAAGDLIAARVAAEEGRDLADAIGDRFNSRHCRMCLGIGTGIPGRSGRSRRTIRRGGRRGRGGSRWVPCGDVASRTRAPRWRWQGETAAARAAADASLESASEFGDAHRERWLLRVGERGPGRRRCWDGAGRDRGGLGARECRAGVCGAPAPRHCAGRTGGRGSDRGSALGRRSGRDSDGMGS